MSAKKNTAAAVAEIALPVAEQLGLTLWDVQFVKEGPSWFLRIIIDKPGGIFIEDCETMSRAVDPLIDALDPTEHEYYLEVSSPGLGRALRTDAHLEAYLNKPVVVKLIRADETGAREHAGTLLSYTADDLALTQDAGTRRFERKLIQNIKADDDRDLLGGQHER